MRKILGEKQRIKLFKVKEERRSELFSLGCNINFLKNVERLKVICFIYLFYTPTIFKGFNYKHS